MEEIIVIHGWLICIKTPYFQRILYNLYNKIKLYFISLAAIHFGWAFFSSINIKHIHAEFTHILNKRMREFPFHYRTWDILLDKQCTAATKMFPVVLHQHPSTKRVTNFIYYCITNDIKSIAVLSLLFVHVYLSSFLNITSSCRVRSSINVVSLINGQMKTRKK